MRLFSIGVLVALLGFSLASMSVAAPPPGHPSIDQASQVMGLDRQAPMAHQGHVLEAIDSNNYTYIRVQTADQQHQWLAAPRLELQPGQQIGFANGVVMHNFYSKKLKRTFKQIHFVPAVRVASR